MGKLRAFGAFWYDFIVGDDWQIAVGVVAALGLTFGLSRAGARAWWIVPLVIVVLLPHSLYRATRHEHRAGRTDATPQKRPQPRSRRPRDGGVSWSTRGGAVRRRPRR